MKAKIFNTSTIISFIVGLSVGAFFCLTVPNNKISSTSISDSLTLTNQDNQKLTAEQEAEVEKFVGEPVDTTRARILIANFRDKIRTRTITENEIPLAVCFTVSELKVLFRKINSDLINIPKQNRGVAFMIGFYPNTETSYRRNKATIIAVSTRFIKSTIPNEEGRVTILDNGVIHHLKPGDATAQETINSTRAYDVGHIYP